MSGINVALFDPRDEIALSILLQAADLSTEDVTPEVMEHFLTAYADKHLIGAVGVEVYGEVGLLRSLVVDEPHRGAGLGKRLVEALEEHAKKAGVQELYLLTTTAEDFFAGLGYRRITREEAPASIAGTAQFAELCPASSCFMQKRLGA